MKRFVTLPVVALVSFMSLPSQAGLIAACTFDDDRNPSAINPNSDLTYNPDGVTASLFSDTSYINTADQTTLNDPRPSPNATYSLGLGSGIGGPEYMTIHLGGVSSSQFVISYAARNIYPGNGNIEQVWEWSDMEQQSWTVVPGVSSVSDNWSRYEMNLSGISVDQFYLRNTISGGAIGIDNLQITAVPEPINYALAGFGLCLGAVSLGRRLVRGRARS